MRKRNTLRQAITIELLEQGMLQKDLAAQLNRHEASLSRAIDSQSPKLIKDLVAIGFFSESQAYLLGK